MRWRWGEKRCVQVASNPADAARGMARCSLGPCRAWADSRRRGMGDGGRRRAVAQTPCTRGPAARRRRLHPSTLAPLFLHEKSLTTTPPPPFPVAAPYSRGRSRSLRRQGRRGRMRGSACSLVRSRGGASAGGWRERKRKRRRLG